MSTIRTLSNKCGNNGNEGNATPELSERSRIDKIFEKCKKEPKKKIARKVYGQISAREKREGVTFKGVMDALSNIRTCIDKHETECILGII